MSKAPKEPKVPKAPAAPAIPKEAKAPKAPAAPKVVVAVDEKNGVVRPASGKTKQVWDTADAMSKAAKSPIPRNELTAQLLADGLVVGTIHTQYAKWRKYHGLTKTIVEAEPKAPKAPKAPKTPALPPVVDAE